MDIDAKVTNVTLRFAREAKLPARPRVRKANQFIVENLESLRGELMREIGQRKLSS